MPGKTKVGIIGCGNISDTYLKLCKTFDDIELVACADMLLERAQAKAREHGIARGCGVDELLGDPDIGIVINLTIPAAHHAVAVRVLEAGKHVYNEKPLTLTREQGREVLELARRKGLRVGCAPDTFLGAAHQAARRAIDRGDIGRPLAAVAFMTTPGHERWHPDPAFYYKPGGGPLFDMGPYYITALVNMLGRVASVTSMAKISHAQRTITSEPRRGQTIDVEVPTHVAGVLEFTGGVTASMIMSFDIWGTNLPKLEVYGSEGSLSVPDPNHFGGVVRHLAAGQWQWSESPVSGPYADNSRGLGVADMAGAIQRNRPHRASGELAYHVLDVMHALHESAQFGRRVEVASTCERPAALPEGLRAGAVDA